MREDFKKRLEYLESKTYNWAAKLDMVDYVGITDYDDGSWKEIHNDEFLTVVQNIETGEIRGVYQDRRTDAEIKSIGGDLAYL